MDSHNNILSFNDWAPQIHFTDWGKRIDALVSKEKLFSIPFLELKFAFQ